MYKTPSLRRRNSKLNMWSTLPFDIPDRIYEELKWVKRSGSLEEYVREVAVHAPDGGAPRVLRQLVARIHCDDRGMWVAESKAKRRTNITTRDAAFELAKTFGQVQLTYQAGQYARDRAKSCSERGDSGAKFA